MLPDPPPPLPLGLVPPPPHGGYDRSGAWAYGVLLLLVVFGKKLPLDPRVPAVLLELVDVSMCVPNPWFKLVAAAKYPDEVGWELALVGTYALCLVPVCINGSHEMNPGVSFFTTPSPALGVSVQRCMVVSVSWVTLLTSTVLTLAMGCNGISSGLHCIGVGCVLSSSGNSQSSSSGVMNCRFPSGLVSTDAIVPLGSILPIQ